LKDQASKGKPTAWKKEKWDFDNQGELEFRFRSRNEEKMMWYERQEAKDMIKKK
jgi:hypothetical protein